MWQAKADTDLTLSASTDTAVVQLTLTMATWRYNTVEGTSRGKTFISILYTQLQFHACKLIFLECFCSTLSARKTRLELFLRLRFVGEGGRMDLSEVGVNMIG